LCVVSFLYLRCPILLPGWGRPRAPQVSFLCLRCADDAGYTACAEMIDSFNSLFEMPRRRCNATGSTSCSVSILCLRCGALPKP